RFDGAAFAAAGDGGSGGSFDFPVGDSFDRLWKRARRGSRWGGDPQAIDSGWLWWAGVAEPAWLWIPCLPETRARRRRGGGGGGRRSDDFPRWRCGGSPTSRG